jgi:3-oxoacyl-[acyl-carrier protein] reductase
VTHETNEIGETGRLGQPAEVADLVLAVLGNAYLTNQVIGLDGGMHPC